MVKQYSDRESFTVDDLLGIMRVLRAPGGCPWDREQDHHSIRGAVIEEAYEAAEAIDREDDAALCEELGDVLLQTVFHADIAEESGAFTFADVAGGICRKLILRHPHVFGDGQADTSGEVLTQWDRIKREEKGQRSAADTLKSVPVTFPALMRAAKVHKRAACAGFDWADDLSAFAKVKEELGELEAAAGESPARAEEELGDLLFAAADIARRLHIDPELALTRATDKFIARFAKMEETISAAGGVMSACAPDELERVWREAKENVIP